MNDIKDDKEIVGRESSSLPDSSDNTIKAAHSFRPHFDRTRKNLIVCGILLVLFCFYGGMAMWFEGFSLSGAVILLAIAAATLLLMHTELKLPFFVRLVIVLLLPACAFLLLESMTHNVFTTMEADAVFLNLVFYYLLGSFLFLITGSTRTALTILLVFANIVGVANYYVILFRSSPILPWDLLSLGTAATVADNYSFDATYQLAWLCGGFLFAITAARKTNISFPKLASRAKQLAVRLALCAVLVVPSVCYVRFLFDPEIADKTSLDNTLFTPKYMFKTDGFFVAFIMDMRYLQIDAPDGYSTAKAKEILDSQDVSDTLPDELPNIIVIMDECFSDLSVLGDFETNEDYMPYIHSLLEGADNTISGHLYVSVLGGNTANTEFEYLTGDSMAFLPKGSVPYQQYVHSSIENNTSQLKDLGYTAYAMHPYNASGWNRSSVYEYFGFDAFYSLKNYKNVEKLRKYVNDKSDFDNLLEVYNSTDEPVFIFNVTMQNHSGYGTAFDNFTPDITVNLKKAKSNKYLTNYLSLMKHTDSAVEYLLSELSESDKPTIVVFFGDHQPNDYVVEPIYKENGLDIDNQTLEQQQKRQQVPFFIWANYDIDEETDVELSANYLSAKVMQVAGLPLSAYQSFLAQMSETIPVINAVGYIGTDGECRYLDDAKGNEAELISTYEKLQYYNLFDNK